MEGEGFEVITLVVPLCVNSNMADWNLLTWDINTTKHLGNSY